MWVHVELKVEKQKVEGSLTGRYVIEENRKGDHTVYSKHHRFLDMKKGKVAKIVTLPSSNSKSLEGLDSSFILNLFILSFDLTNWRTITKRE